MNSNPLFLAVSDSKAGYIRRASSSYQAVVAVEDDKAPSAARSDIYGTVPSSKNSSEGSTHLNLNWQQPAFVPRFLSHD